MSTVLGAQSSTLEMNVYTKKLMKKSTNKKAETYFKAQQTDIDVRLKLNESVEDK